MLWLQMCLGSKIGDSPIGMWYISPICKGIGIALLTAHGVSLPHLNLFITLFILYFLQYLDYNVVYSNIFRLGIDVS